MIFNQLNYLGTRYKVGREVRRRSYEDIGKIIRLDLTNNFVVVKWDHYISRCEPGLLILI